MTSRKQSPLLRTTISSFLLGFFLLSHSFASANDAPQADKGVLDLRDWKFHKNKPINLSGDWEFYWNQVLYPADFDSTHIEPVFRLFPKEWEKEVINGDTIGPIGYSTQRLKVVLNSVTPELAISIPHFYSSYLLFINGEYIASNGQFGMSDSTSTPHWNYITRDLKVISDTLDIILQISNFKHSTGGATHNISLGEKVVMRTIQGRQEAYDLIMASSLFFVGLFFLVLFWFGGHEKQILYYALFCLFYSYRLIGAGTYTLHTLFPDIPWIITLKAEYISMFLSSLFFAFYSFYLYKRETSRFFILMCSGVCISFTMITLFFPVKIFAELAIPFSIFILLQFGYMFYTYIRAMINKREGSKLSLLSSSILFLVIGSVTLEYFGLVETSMIYMFIGYQQFFFFQSIILFYGYNRRIEMAKEKAESAARSQSDFLSMISHEIRTPLNGVIGLTNFLISDKPKTEHMDDLKTLKFSAEHLHVLINDVLDYSKLDAGKIEFEEVDTNIVETAGNIIKGLDSKAKEKDIYINFLHDEEIPKFIVCDGLRLSQILNNLLGNAIKFTEFGGVTLSMSKITLTKKKVSIKFSIEDSGIGIPKEKLKSIFDSFSQASSSTTREYGGTGLGLSITKRILDLQNTKINVFSVVGQGSRFYFSQTFTISENQTQKIETVTEKHNELKGKRILLVEDNPVNVMVASKFLSRWSMDIDLAENGQEALEKAIENKYDLILMDLQMPVMDGYTSSRSIRDKGIVTPILALTASVMLDVGDRVYKSGMNDFITKPFNPNDLYNKIRHYILNHDPNGEGKED